ncbi:MAG TPA: diaminopimelate epimerase [Rhodospirillales bacterium]|nr:diaminopimelate epimerase [Rhodospirillales bacterium]
MAELPFVKMHGLGNDFVVVDARAATFAPDAARVRALADRHTGVGCDQLIVVEKPRSALADAFMRIRNADGGEVAACGNATRCVAALLMREKGEAHAIIETAAGLLDAEAVGDGLIGVDMGRIAVDWREIPLAEATDTLHLPIEIGPLRDGVAVNVGNPHAVFFVDDAAAVAIKRFGPLIERHPLFPERTNVGVAQIISRDRLRLRVWERGAGLTRACGTGACAAAVAAARRGLTDRAVTVELDGGTLRIEWLRDDHVLMTGPVATAFTGVLDPSLAG